jgi:hypothetical protein
LPALEPMLGHGPLEPEEPDCDAVLVWLLVEVAVAVVLACAKTPLIDESAAMTEMARTEYARMLLLLLLKPILKLIFSFHLPVTFDLRYSNNGIARTTLNRQRILPK